MKPQRHRLCRGAGAPGLVPPLRLHTAPAGGPGAVRGTPPTGHGRLLGGKGFAHRPASPPRATQGPGASGPLCSGGQEPRSSLLLTPGKSGQSPGGQAPCPGSHAGSQAGQGRAGCSGRGLGGVHSGSGDPKWPGYQLGQTLPAGHDRAPPPPPQVTLASSSRERSSGLGAGPWWRTRRRWAGLRRDS